MSNSFFDAFNSSNDEAERVMGEEWYFKGSRWLAIAIEEVTAGQQAMKGGRFSNATTTIELRLAIAQQSGVGKNSVIKARGEELRVLEVGTSGDDAVKLYCGPASVRTN